MPRRLGLGVIPALALSLVASAALAAAESKFRVTDRAKVYHGYPDAFTTPAVVDSARVLDSLPSMKRIRDEKVVRDTAKWHLLINEANQHFQRLIRTVAKEGGYDLVAEVGFVTGPRAIPNATDAALAAAARA